ncbi:hypothetical protein DICPUDRAFT_92881 [Dictyostelium purpureum]|uniref:Uncharacterized protein n=1 Tax=Dictyostelium purpureum TaxID=5786 RepID=F0ZYJ7_DICPU|nr:uncharacterized protein DICPUDRAFT_92881 [Dictyostelium purpureum]EGC30992.1 hypothetical protein DICPUDRAFT_92881 [Dictyostelium purpureum]|eukprot:XP_003292493.1 hypothetical protein DICPUDRAFT_92881 [Dictyostelium purpureum]
MTPKIFSNTVNPNTQLIKSLKYTSESFQNNLADLPHSLTNLELGLSYSRDLSQIRYLKSLVALKLSIKFVYFSFDDKKPNQFPDSLTLLELGTDSISYLLRSYTCQGGVHHKKFQINNTWIPKNIKNLILWGNPTYMRQSQESLIPQSIYIHNSNKNLNEIINQDQNLFLEKFRTLNTTKMKKVYKNILNKYIKQNNLIN